MRRLKTSRILSAGVAAAAALVGLGAGPSGLTAQAATHPAHLSSNAPVTVVATGLNSPRALAWGKGHHLYVSEVGVTPQVCTGTGFDTRCFGFTGSIADITSGQPVRVATGLASNFNEEEVVGANGLTYADGHLYTLETGSPEQVPAELPADLATPLKQSYGALLKIGSHGQASSVANVGTVDYQWTTAHKDLAPNDYPASNPIALMPKKGGGFYLVDAAANTLDSVDRHGNVQVLAWFPNTPVGSNAVPSCLDRGPDGSIYVGQITGHGNSATAANIYKYSPRTGQLSVWQSGFSAVSGCGFGANGDFYVTELDTTGFLPTGAPDGVVIQINHRTNERTVLGEGKLFAPMGFLAGPDGSVYVTTNTMMWPACDDAPACNTANEVHATDGQVVKIG